MTTLSIEQFEFFQNEPELQTLHKLYLGQSLKKIWGKLPSTLSHPQLFPLVWSSLSPESNSSHLSVFCLGPFQNKFLHHFHKYCLKFVHPEPVDTISLSAIDFIVPFKGVKQRLTLCHVQFNILNQAVAKPLEKKLERCASYLRLGHFSLFFDTSKDNEKEFQEDHRHKIYELLSKTRSLIPEFLKTLVPIKLQQLLASSPSHFLYERSPKHIVNLAAQFAHMELKAKNCEKKNKRKAWVHHTARWIHTSNRPQKIECWSIVLNFLKSNETLEERHFLQIFVRLAPNLKKISFFTSFRDPESKLIHYYIEIPSHEFQKSDSKRLASLQPWVANEILNRVERKPLALFKPFNEEESFKWLFTLSNEVSHKTDIPHIALTFHNQTDEKLIFHLLIARVYENTSSSLEKLLQTKAFDHDTKFHIDKVKKIPSSKSQSFEKEISCIEVEVTKTPFLREDFCVNIQRARFFLLKKLQETLGPIRDYNGGLIAKQQELFEDLESKLKTSEISRNISFIEDLFFNLQPAPAVGNFETDIYFKWMSLLAKVKLQSHEMPQVQRLIFDRKDQNLQATGIWFVGLSESNMEKVRLKINNSLRHDHELVWTQKRKSNPLIIGCLVKTRQETHKIVAQTLEGLLPKATTSRKKKKTPLE